MKLRNKKTGEIIDIYKGQVLLHYDGGKKTIHFKSIEELGDWEDYEEPKKHYEILATGAVMEREDAEDDIFRNQGQREIGNYFGSEEEAELALRKLKAWKRLKDNGFKFQFWTSSYSGDNISFFIDWINADSKKEIEADLDLLFEGE